MKMSVSMIQVRRTQHLPKYTFYTFINQGEEYGLKSIARHLKIVNGSESSLLPQNCIADITKQPNEEKSNKKQIKHV